GGLAEARERPQVLAIGRLQLEDRLVVAAEAGGLGAGGEVEAGEVAALGDAEALGVDRRRLLEEADRPLRVLVLGLGQADEQDPAERVLLLAEAGVEPLLVEEAEDQALDVLLGLVAAVG